MLVKIALCERREAVGGVDDGRRIAPLPHRNPTAHDRRQKGEIAIRHQAVDDQAGACPILAVQRVRDLEQRAVAWQLALPLRSAEHTFELQSLMRTPEYGV